MGPVSPGVVQGVVRGVVRGLCGHFGSLGPFRQAGRCDVALLSRFYSLSDCKAQRFMLFGKMLDFTMDSYNY